MRRGLVLLGAFGALACGGPKSDGLPARLVLRGRLAEARAESDRVPALPERTELGWLDQGVAWITLPLATAAAEERSDGDLQRYSWKLPARRVARLPWGDAPEPELLEAEEPRFKSALKRASELGGGMKVSRDTFEIALPDGWSVPREVHLGYPVQACELLGWPALEGERPDALFAGWRDTGDRATESVLLPTGKRLVFHLPPTGKRTLRFTASTDTAPGGELVLDRGGAALGRYALLPGEPVAVELPLPASPEPWTLGLRSEATGLVHLEDPSLDRPRVPGDPPNLLVLLVDTLRADRLSVYGGSGGAPALDRLAAESLVFTDAWSTSSWTLPAVTTLFTSNHAEQHTARTRTHRLGPGLTTLAELLQEAGYQTAAFTDGGYVRHAFGLNRGFGLFDAQGGGVDAVWERGRAFLDERARVDGGGGAPWFLFLHTYEVHAPYEPDEEAQARVDARFPGVLGGRASDPWAVADLFEPYGEGYAAVPPRVSDYLEALYDEEVAHTDRVLGELLDELRESGALAETLVVLTSDHGEEFGEHGALGHSDTLYREQLQVPFALRFPDGHPRAGGARDERAVSMLDFFPTVVDALGLAERLIDTTCEGVSLLSDLERSPIYATRFHPEAGFLHAHRAGDQVWIQGRYRGPRPSYQGERYDLATDPLQAHNVLATDPEAAAAVIARLRPLVERFGRPKVAADEALLDPSLGQELEDLGYF